MKDLLATAARIGPNAITQMSQAMCEMLGAPRTAALFSQAELAHYWSQPPQGMVSEVEVARLHKTLQAQLEPALLANIQRQAGFKTARYLLAKRIPKAVQLLLRVLPAPAAARLLLKAIAAHSWTFVGSGQFDYQVGQTALLTIGNNPLCRGRSASAPVCDFYAATFERLFQVLVQSQTTCRETTCAAQGDDACRFELRWR